MIDKTPAVGRYVLRESDIPGRWIDREWVGKITAIKGKQLTFDRQFKQIDDPATESRKMLMWKVAAVCDTKDEVMDLLNIDDQIQQYYKQYVINRETLIRGSTGDQQ